MTESSSTSRVESDRRMRMTGGGDLGRLRHFGVIVGGVFLVISIWPLAWRGGGVRLWAAVLGLALAAAGLLWPHLLRRPYQLWMACGHALGVVNTRLILGFVYFVVITPIGLVMRLIGRDPLDRRLGNRPSYWIKRPATSEPLVSMERRF